MFIALATTKRGHTIKGRFTWRTYDCEALAAPSEEESRKNYFTYLMGRCLCTPPYPIY
jgi:hypothetical protein